MIQILRIEQWIKNFVIFIPALLAGEISVFSNIDIYLIFLCFSILASATYIFNDISDIDQDREHPEKKFRPLPSGKINIKSAKILGYTLISFSFITVYTFYNDLSPYFLTYLFITVAYSKKLKYIKYFDFISISVLFFIRTLIGGIFSEVSLTNYFIFFILSILNLLSLGKKLSILNNPNIIKNTKIKNHLKKNYKSYELRNFSIISSVATIIIFLFWIFNQGNFSFYQNVISFISILLLVFFCYKFIKDSVNFKTENFVKWSLNYENLILITAMCALVLLKVY